MHSIRMRTACFSGHLSCHKHPHHTCPPQDACPPTMHTPCHACSLATNTPYHAQGAATHAPPFATHAPPSPCMTLSPRMPPFTTHPPPFVDRRNDTRLCSDSDAIFNKTMLNHQTGKAKQSEVIAITFYLQRFTFPDRLSSVSSSDTRRTSRIHGSWVSTSNWRCASTSHWRRKPAPMASPEPTPSLTTCWWSLWARKQVSFTFISFL